MMLLNLLRKWRKRIPTLFRYKNYYIYFWSNEGIPLEPFHLHIAKNSPSQNSDKVWITNENIIKPDKSISNLSTREISKVIEYITDEMINKAKTNGLKSLEQSLIKNNLSVLR